MTTISVALRIWAKAVFLFGVCMVITAVSNGDFGGIMLAGLCFIVGFIVTLPLLLPIFSLVDLSKRLLQYNIQARMAWLVFYLTLMMVCLSELFFQITDHRSIELDKFFCQGIFITAGILMVSVRTTRRSLNKLYIQSQ